MIAQQVKLAAAPWFALNPQFFPTPLAQSNSSSIPVFCKEARSLSLVEAGRRGQEGRGTGVREEG